MIAKRIGRERGQSLVEFAAILVPLLMLLFGILEFGRAFYSYATIVNAASEGARYGILDPNNTACIKKVVENYSIALGLVDANVTVSTPSGVGFDKPINVAVTYTFTALAPYIPSFTFNGASTMTIVHV